MARGIKVSIAFPNGLRGDRMDHELIDKLKEAGCYCITYALETASPRLQKKLKKNIDLDKLKAADMRVLVEPLYGSGSGWTSRLLEGGTIVVDEIHSERNPWFGGVNPEPIRPHIDEALRRVRDCGYDLGLVLDGDADRAGAIDENGVFIHQLQCYGLLAYYMLEHRGERAPLVTTVNETSMAFRLGEQYGVDVHETPVGFKFVGPKMIVSCRNMDQLVFGRIVSPRFARRLSVKAPY